MVHSERLCSACGSSTNWANASKEGASSMQVRRVCAELEAEVGECRKDEYLRNGRTGEGEVYGERMQVSGRDRLKDLHSKIDDSFRYSWAFHRGLYKQQRSDPPAMPLSTPQ